MAQGQKLNKALEWFNKAVQKEQEGNAEMMKKCLDFAIRLEAEGLAAGESWD